MHKKLMLIAMMAMIGSAGLNANVKKVKNAIAEKYKYAKNKVTSPKKSAKGAFDYVTDVKKRGNETLLLPGKKKVMIPGAIVSTLAGLALIADAARRKKNDNLAPLYKALKAIREDQTMSKSVKMKATATAIIENMIPNTKTGIAKALIADAEAGIGGLILLANATAGTAIGASKLGLINK